MYDELVKRLISLSEIDAIQQELGVCSITMECIGAIKDIAIEAADAIEELSKGQKHLSEQVAKWQAEVVKGDCEAWLSEQDKPKWIPVTERLPELGEEVLVYYHWISPPEKGSITRDSMYIHDRSMKPVWKKHLGGKVTHWMPLPEPPKEDM